MCRSSSSHTQLVYLLRTVLHAYTDTLHVSSLLLLEALPDAVCYWVQKARYNTKVEKPLQISREVGKIGQGYLFTDDSSPHQPPARLGGPLCMYIHRRDILRSNCMGSEISDDDWAWPVAMLLRSCPGI